MIRLRRSGGRRAATLTILLALAGTHGQLDDEGDRARAAASSAADDVCEGAAECDAEALALRQLRGVRRHMGEALEGLGPQGGPGPSAGEVEREISSITFRRSAPRTWTPWSVDLAAPSTAPLYTFYMYRAVSSEKYSPINVNAANIAGVLWYLHHEVVIQYPRKFKIANIERFKVQMRATTPLLQKGMHFGPRLAMDRGQATGPFVCGREKAPLGNPEPKFCDGAFDTEKEAEILPANGKPYKMSFEYGRYGFHVGCNNLGEYPFPMYEVYYPDSVWYTLPGACPSETFDKASKACVEAEPGGLCEGEPTGEGDCTWSYEYMGRLSIDKLVDVPVDQLHRSGGREYNPDTDSGIGTSFWDGINDTQANERRIEKLRDLFATEFPDQERDEDIPSPPCDFNFGMFYKEFWYKAPFSGKCQDAVPGDECYKMMQFGKTDGIHGHPEWYPGLSPSSTLKEFQQLFFMQGKEACPYRPCGIAEGDEEPWSSSIDGNSSVSKLNSTGIDEEVEGRNMSKSNASTSMSNRSSTGFADAGGEEETAAA